jgi:hypothetical protein
LPGCFDDAALQRRSDRKKERAGMVIMSGQAASLLVEFDLGSWCSGSCDLMFPKSQSRKVASELSALLW